MAKKTQSEDDSKLDEEKDKKVDDDGDEPKSERKSDSRDDGSKDRDRDRDRNRDRDRDDEVRRRGSERSSRRHDDYDDYNRGSRDYAPPQQPMFTADKIPKFIAIGILIGILLLFIGALLSSTAISVKVEGQDSEDEEDLQRNLRAGGHFMGSIGMFLIGLFVVLPLLLAKDLSDRQKQLMGILLLAVIIGFSLLI